MEQDHLESTLENFRLNFEDYGKDQLNKEELCESKTNHII